MEKRNKTSHPKTRNLSRLPERIAKWFGEPPFHVRRETLEMMPFAFDTKTTSDETMQAIADEAKAEGASDPDSHAFEAAVRDAAVRHGVPFRHKTSKWEVTDPDCNQRCRIHVREDGRTLAYEYEQDTPEGKASAEIVVQDEDINSEDFAKVYLQPYGYDNLHAVRSIYGSDWEQIVAECIFETDIDEFIQ